MKDLFEVPTTLTAGFKQFYDHESDPLIARISTNSKIGQVSSVNSSETPPGLQYLAVYETEPVESLLDIYWETTSSGLISSLNTAILTGTGGGASLSSFNTNNWSEALASGGDILNAGFQLLNQTGQVITIAGNNSFTLTSVIDGTGQDVQNLPSAGPYFQIYLDSGFYKIRTTSTYYSQVYFNSNPKLREFTFNFRSIIIDASNVPTTTLFSEFATVNNVSPIITASPASGTTINTNRDNLNTLVTLSSVNGANNTSLAAKDLTWNIISQQVTGDVTGAQVDYFELTTPVVTTNSATTFKNKSSATEAKSYDVVIGCSDPGATPQVSYVINVSFTPTFVRDYNINYSLTSGGRIAVNFVVIYAQNGINTNQVGYYLIASSNPVSSGNALTFNSQIVTYQTNLTLVNISGGGTASSPITLNKTGADLAVNGTCNVQDGFITYFNTNLNTLLTDNVNTFVRSCFPDGSIQNTTFSNELTSTDLQQYVFEII